MAKQLGILYLCVNALLYTPVCVNGISNDVNYISVLQNLGLGKYYLHNTQNEHYAIKLLSNSLESNIYNIPTNLTSFVMSRNFNVSEKCLQHTEAVMTSLGGQEMWAIKVFDSTGKLGSGLLSGNLLWLGSFHECHQISQAIPVPSGDGEELFEGKHCTVTIANVSAKAGPENLAGIPFTLGGLELGVCLSSVCDEEDAGGLVNSVISIGSPYYGAAKVRCAKEIPLDTSAIVVICILSTIGFILTVATLYDLLVYRKIHQNILLSHELPNGKTESSDDAEKDHSTTPRSTLRVDEYTPLLQPRMDERPINVKEPTILLEKEQSLKSKILVGVSLYSNSLKLLSVETSAGTLGCLHGIRFLSLTWVILGHTCVFGIILFKNPVIITELMKDWSFQVILNATVSVDSFFVLSGALVAYHLLQQLDLRGPRQINWPVFFFHRFWRLSAPYMIVLAAYVTLFKYWGTGPLWPQEGADQSCRSYWWVNMLFLNNVIPNRLFCLGWSWYLACDMQFYIISPVVLLLFYKKAVLGILVTLALWVGSTIYTMVIVVQNSYPPGLQGFLIDPIPALNWFTDVYVTPWCRVGPYLVGLCLGYALHKSRGRRIQMHWAVVATAWLAASACNLAVVYGLFAESNGHVFSDVESAIYNGLHRTGWALGLSWLIFACVQGYGGIVNRILCWGPFVVLSRTTYMAYLIHPIVMNWYYLSRQSPIYLDNLEAVYLFLSHLFVSYGFAFVLTLAIESPLIGLEKIVLKRFHL